ncbi:hypothetical protein GUITHDRAFT_104032 [Guillardia theta CCMP2712]|uniref:Uncharacterized protein n=1 Tax=Guillardia theta (strain CCMP2712) TaxID=905079 RepID=L1JQ62_GUITC|nr:hypothetical protein GUITHDRAFT_104032 [Guillardia theta CCMP2712]EKX50218.1 hypothetical protein GUITHDRAFT_104032 [Guillardia theta CCMP2712]|eukprot:XP_005837198.1 hypothetical protein GUITHDRAFT_104032 [Guillardia theta CCMP2712]
MQSVDRLTEDENSSHSMEIASHMVNEVNASIMTSLSYAKSVLSDSYKPSGLMCAVQKQTRRSARKRMRPLQFWRHERIEYQRKNGSVVPEISCIFVLTPNSKKRA